ncbi:MAG TPA: asparagine--tRNA ligase [Polyangia bacterium]|nr:asparagine--tRNA ligase [Polyangia bacterium]
MATGWVRTARRGKGVAFVELTDGTCAASLQVVVAEALPDFEAIARASVGAALRVTGRLVESPAAGQRVELEAGTVEVVGPSGPDYPLQKKRHGFEFLRTIAHLRPRAKTFGAVFRVRHALQMAIHRFFDDRGFVQVHTPIITASDAEGAGQMFRVTTLDADAPPRAEGRVDFSRDFFGRATSLTVSGQLEAEIFACALGKVYTFGPTFRAENSNTSRHLAEFWMIEPEMAFCDLRGDMALAEDFVRGIVGEVLARCPEDIDFFDQWVEKGLRARLEKLAASRFEALTYTEAVATLEKSGKAFEYPVRWGADLQSEHERWLTEEHVGGPAFVIDYPREIKAFYMRVNDDERTVAAMDLLVPGVGEIIGGSQREERLEVLDVQLQRFGLEPEIYWWYRDLRRFGSVPHAGFGLGFERMLMYVTGMQNIRDVIPFARTPGSADF